MLLQLYQTTTPFTPSSHGWESTPPRSSAPWSDPLCRHLGIEDDLVAYSRCPDRRAQSLKIQLCIHVVCWIFEIMRQNITTIKETTYINLYCEVSTCSLYSPSFSVATFPKWVLNRASECITVGKYPGILEGSLGVSSNMWCIHPCHLDNSYCQYKMYEAIVNQQLLWSIRNLVYDMVYLLWLNHGRIVIVNIFVFNPSVLSVR